jgi:hypothetical protein
MDLSKAFDSLPHKLFISKLHAYGVTLNSCVLMASYLTNRQQRVKHHGVKSDWYTLKKGVPQGSILGPLIFNIFINDLLWNIEESIYNYADDNTIAVIGEDRDLVKVRLAKSSENCIKWFKDNMLQANPNKFQFMLFDRMQDSVSEDLTVDGVSIKSVQSVKLLGVTLDCKLNYTEHITNLCRRASKNLNITKRISYLIKGQEERLALINAFVHSMFSYCPLIWHFCNITCSKKIEKIHERSLRFVLNDYESSYEYLLVSLDCDTLMLRRLKFLAIHMFRCYNNYNPSYVNIYTQRNTPYDLRDDKKVNLFEFKTKQFGYKTLLYAGAKLWNSLPVHLKRCDDVEVFKVELRKWKCKSTDCMNCQNFTYH